MTGKQSYASLKDVTGTRIMPVIKSAIKKLRHDRVKEKENNLFRKKLEQAFSTAQKTRTPKAISMAFSVIDKGVKKNLIHKNKAKRMKSKL
ncbi:MAG: 30S ribosomal protein S20, partial [Candidatus Levyibacteriota bacterium]